MTELLTVPEAAELLGVHPSSVYQAIYNGRLRAIQMLGRKALHKADVLEYQKRTEGVGPKGGRPKKSAGTTAQE